MDFTVLTIFPEMIDAFFHHGIVRRAVESGTISGRAVDIRDYTKDRHRTVDDRPYGGGSGMVMKPEPLAAAIQDARDRKPEARTVLLSPQGRVFTQQEARSLAADARDLILVCGRYEGIDERVCREHIDDEISVGDYVLTGGEVPAMIVIDAVTRLLPGALGGEDSAEKETFQQGLIEHAHYTRPPVFGDEAVPDVLLSGNHARIDAWRLENSLVRTLLKRPDLLLERDLSPEEKKILKAWFRKIEILVSDEPD
ncbi:MAG: tRNA (guanosine(37)-N1)-methyltransferase TrmD [Thermodesulfobacteriota bacterium]